ncbi:hypothetical protein KKG46_03125 [Patescibacteria group bacterium]|nr:hypothetical protein [Patescibacteria group bacterium]
MKNELKQTERTDLALKKLTAQVARVADMLEKQNRIKRKFFLGLMFGLGTALGASVIASLLVISLSRLFSLAGIDSLIIGDDTVKTFEQQIKLQTPQE